MIEIRAMQASEQEAVAQLFHDVWHETQGPLQDLRIAQFRDLTFFRRRLAVRAERTLVAHVGGKLAGFACWTAAHLDSLFATREFRSHGLGTKLLAAAEMEMEKSAPRPFHLTCICGNHSGRRFYERHGWYVASEEQQTEELSDGPAFVPAWMMQK